MPKSNLLPLYASALLASILATFGTPAAAAGDDASVWVRVVDTEGNTVRGIDPSSFQILEDGRPRRVVAAGEPTSPCRVVVLIDELFSSPRLVRSAITDLTRRARQLTDLGPVEVVLAGRELETALPPTRDPEELVHVLSWIAVRKTPEDAQAAIRRELLDQLTAEPTRAGGAGLAGGDRERIRTALASALARERSLLRLEGDLLIDWAARDPKGGEPRLLLLVTEGADRRPEDFYRAALDAAAPEGAAALGAVLGAPGPEPPPDPAPILAAYGWTTLAYLPATPSETLPGAEEDRGAEGKELTPPDLRKPEDTTPIDFAGLLKKALRRRKEAAEGPPVPLRLAPRESVDELTRATGGGVATTPVDLDRLLALFPGRDRLRFEGGGSPLGEIHRLEVRAKAPAGAAGTPWTALAPEWIATGTPEAVSEVRARRLLSGEGDEGDLGFSAVLEPKDDRGRLLLELDAGTSVGTTLRATIAVAGEEGTGDEDDAVSPAGVARVFHRQLAAPAPDVHGARPEISLDLPVVPDPDTPVVVVLEDLASGRWGGAYASLVESAATEVAAEPILLPSPKPIRLVGPSVPMAMGPTPFSAVVARSGVERVEYDLDGERVAVASAPPWATTIDLGPVPRTRQVDAVALGPAGTELGRDTLLVNQGAGSFRVRIVEPRPSSPGASVRRVGAVDVEADVSWPRDIPLDRVDFFWNTERVATRYAPPFRQRLTVPSAAPQGFIRVVARLQDGTTAEDVLFLNSPGGSERLDVNLVQLFTVVTDRHGHPVPDLTQKDFQVLEEGTPQEIANFSDAADLPLTVGLAIDASASMFVKLPKVERAAATFVGDLDPSRDRAFLVGFGDQPQLTQPPTGRLTRIVKALSRLEPTGKTGIWKGTVYSLVQLQGAPGRKALIVYTDGADEDADFPFRTCLRFARQIGIPIYLILSNNEIVRTGGKGLTVRGFLHRAERLTEAVGGRIFLTRVGADLDAVYRQIQRELDSQYLLAYYSKTPRGGPWQRVEVRTDLPAVRVRTVEGYFP